MITKERIEYIKNRVKEFPSQTHSLSIVNDNTILDLIEYIEWQDSINTDLARECETWEAKYIREEEREMRDGNA